MAPVGRPTVDENSIDIKRQCFNHGVIRGAAMEELLTVYRVRT
jgi:hypothetical protein